MTDADLRVIVNRITYKDWVLRCRHDGRHYIQWVFMGPCVKTGTEQPQHCRKWYLSEHMTESEVVQTAFAAALQAEEHECREFFVYAGKRPFQPHIALSALMAVCGAEEVRS